MAKIPLRAYNREIETMIDRGQLDEAIAHCHHILKTFPKHLETYRLLGKAYLEYKRYGDAADIFSRVLVSVPNDFVAQVGMSIIRDEENKLDDAIWHMERAFETQPSNTAIQGELQRLYGRRDGVQPPRIRMTRGALAHMYVQGELYPQAISEIRNVLKEDAGRSDMQALLARAYYKSGLKNDAADVASTLLRRYPYSLDGNRVLAEILEADRSENVQVYRQRVVELDPYAAQVAGTIFQSNEVSDAAVTLERLDWNGQPVGMQSDWGETRAIGLEGGTPSGDEQPDWLKSSVNEVTPPPLQPTPASIFDTPAAPAQPPAETSADIPDFLRHAGWGQSTGTVDESKPVFTEEETAPAQSLEQGDLPDWVKAMKPSEPPVEQEAEEELPDWINKIGAGALSSQASDPPDWMQQSEISSEPTPSAMEDQSDWLKGLDSVPESTAPVQQADDSDWLKGLGSEPQPTLPTAQADDLDWLKGLGSEPEPAPPAGPAEDLDWLKGLGSEPITAPSAAQTDEPDWLKGFASETESEISSAAARADQPDWLNQLNAETEEAPSTPSTTDFDFLDQLTEEPILQTPPEATPSIPDLNNLGVSEQERDDSFAWLEALAAKQGASEGLLTKPEDRLEEEPEWVKQAKGLSASQPPASVEPPVSELSTGLDEPGKSEQDDSFAWLEDLAAKQDVSEDLLTQPEERLEPEADWVMETKDLDTQQPPVTSPSANLDELGKTEQERDDSFAWLENLAAKQGASEGLLTKPEDRLEQEPEWVRQAKDVGVQQPPVTSPSANLDELGKTEQER
ncbi:MAG: tetratricopeptide repeat protein, partial [Chloroflexota bacterium]